MIKVLSGETYRIAKVVSDGHEVYATTAHTSQHSNNSGRFSVRLGRKAELMVKAVMVINKITNTISDVRSMVKAVMVVNMTMNVMSDVKSKAKTPTTSPGPNNLENYPYG